MLVKAYSGAVIGIGAIRISIEVHITQGIRFFIVGLADHAIRESQQRIESALGTNGYQWPRFRVVINLAPADIRKEGSHFDLPIAVGILAASQQVGLEQLENYLMMGELSLDGSLLPVRGVLSMALLAREEDFKGVVVPAGNAAEASVVEDIEVVGAENLEQVVSFLNGDRTKTPTWKNLGSRPGMKFRESQANFSEVKGQALVKRAMMVAAGGAHNLLLVGPPGSGKSMMAKRLPSILPPMSLEESLQTTRIYSVAGRVSARKGLIQTRPFRSPHHSSSNIAMIGGGSSPQPGEISLSHNGVLFLDELPEFKRTVLEVLRQPLEEREIHISRANYRVSYPADFMLVAAMNPCPCGFYNHPGKECHCGPGMIKQYLSRISGPLLDRIDIQLEVLPVPFSHLSQIHGEEKSETMLEGVEAARQMQQKRFAGIDKTLNNARMGNAHRMRFCKLDKAGSVMIRKAMEMLGLSARAYDRLLRVARTIADLEQCEHIHPSHVAEAISYRNLDREGWSG